MPLLFGEVALKVVLSMTLWRDGGLIMQCCTASLESGHYMVFPWLVVSCEILVFTGSLRWDHFTTEE